MGYIIHKMGTLGHSFWCLVTCYSNSPAVETNNKENTQSPSSTGEFPAFLIFFMTSSCQGEYMVCRNVCVSNKNFFFIYERGYVLSVSAVCHVYWISSSWPRDIKLIEGTRRQAKMKIHLVAVVNAHYGWTTTYPVFVCLPDDIIDLHQRKVSVLFNTEKYFYINALSNEVACIFLTGTK